MVLKFTVEQIDLVRRLKDTGVTMKEIGIIYYKLERLERTIRRGAEQRRSPPQQQHYAGANGGGFTAPNGITTPPSTTNVASAPQPTPPSQATPRNEDEECSSSSEGSSTESPSHNHQQQNGFQQDCAIAAVGDGCQRSATAPPDSSQGHPNAVVPRGEPVPTDVTAGMVNNWFCNRRKDASKLLKHPTPSTDMTRLPQDALKRLTKQRERFTFVKGHLEILERHYQRNPYPSQNDKERVVEECNAYSMESGSSRCGFMTITNVSNWFANRRKREFHRSVQTPDTFTQSPSSYNTVTNVGGRSLWSSDLTVGPHHQAHHPHHHHHNGGMQTTIKEEPLDFDTAAAAYDRKVLPESGMSWSTDLDGGVTHVPSPYQPVPPPPPPMGLGPDGPPRHGLHGMSSPVPGMVHGGEGSTMQLGLPQHSMHQPVKQEGGDVWPLDNRVLSTGWR
nr:homeobox-containing protein 1-like isoform X2 [Rhipicephalus microplus]